MEGRKEMFYLTTHSTHFICGYMVSDIWLRTIMIVKMEGRKMFYLTTHSTHFIYGLYGVRHMVKDHSDSERGNQLLPHTVGFSFWLTARVLLYAPSHRQDSTYHGLCYTSRGARMEREMALWVHPMKDQSNDPSHHEWMLLPWNYISFPHF